ncbi:hypothetical protein BV22DRAFT_1041812 [Leucogyrophana mollusca]|uniref:Uncharacterized protein n=1 Tax=Leucogyrophana mollusca TaxID=85980 RepID=A0ACB8AZQ3_9AGAM|nr:hypothetical protein BV22DRAFT_1041812 [Leucogyrophana mollusca]
MENKGVHSAKKRAARRMLILLNTLNIASPLVNGSSCEDETRVTLVHNIPVDRSEYAWL